ncbi:MAG: hypothetical protein WBD61_06195 [Desulfobulbales bacterium]|jgi:uncharacterized membrane protein
MNKKDKDALLSRREFLAGLKKWSKVVIASAIGISVASKADAASWVNRYGGSGGSWVNRHYGGGGWINGGGGSWANRYGGGGWINRR